MGRTRIDAAAQNLYNPAMQISETRSPPPGLLITGHFHERPPYAVYRPHGSGNWLITYTLRGQGLYRQPGFTVEAKPGDVVLLQPDALHDYAVPPGSRWEFLWAHFHPRPAWLSWWRLPHLGHGLFSIHVHTPQVQARIRQIFLNLHADTLVLRPPEIASGQEKNVLPGDPSLTFHPDILRRELALNRLEEILLLAIQENEQQQHKTLDPRIQQVLDLLSADLAASHDVASLAAAVALSPSRLGHLFKEEVGDALINTLLSLRLRQAARLLEHTPHSISMIAEEVGFNSPFYFSRQFRQHFGLSPRAYRDVMKQ